MEYCITGEAVPLLDKLGKKLTHVGQEALNNTQRLADLTTLKAKAAEEEKALRRIYAQLGEKCYRIYGKNPPPELAELCGSATGSRRRLEELAARIRQLRGVRKCAHCGGELPAKAYFCAACGAGQAEQLTVVRYCPECGKEAAADEAFCTGCGHTLERMEDLM